MLFFIFCVCAHLHLRGISAILLCSIIHILMTNITIYTSPSCGYCVQAKNLMDREGIPYTEVDVLMHPDQRDAIVEQTGHMTLPIIMNGDTLIGGYDDLARLHAEGTLLT